MAEPFHFEHQLAFAPDRAAETLGAIPALPGVFALYGPDAADGQPTQPYLTRAADLRRRIKRILAPPDSQSRRLNLSARVARIKYTITGSEFESILCLYHASAALFGLDEARRRLRLRTPFFLRFTAENAYPRVYSTNRLSKRSLENFYGPFSSRAAADRYLDAVLDLFKLRRCYEELTPYPEHPGCVYGEMNKCLAPCNQACSPAGAAAYSAESAAVKRFFDTRGESLIVTIGSEREEASAALEFERAAALHERWHKVKAAQSLADELVQPIPSLSAIVVQKARRPEPDQRHVILDEDASASAQSQPIDLPGAPRLDSETWVQQATPEAAIFLLHSGCLTGPARLSTLGVRAARQQTSVGSSLFAQPLMLQAIPLDELTPSEPVIAPSRLAPIVLGKATEQSVDVSNPAQPKELDASLPSNPSATHPASASDAPCLVSETSVDATGVDATQPTALPSTLSPELRATNLIASLEQEASAPTDLATLSDHLSLLRRWYYRPEKQRTGEIFFPKAEGSFPKAEISSPKAEGSLPNLHHEWPIRRILNAAARAALGDPRPMADPQRDLATGDDAEPELKPARTKTLHAGRPDVEREVPVLDKPNSPKRS